MSVPPPPPDPLHWSTVNALAGEAPSSAMLFTMLTLQTVLLPPSMFEKLHWCTALTTSEEFKVCDVQGPRVQLVTMVVDEEVPPAALMLFVIEIEHVSVSAAPLGSAACPLH